MKEKDERCIEIAIPIRTWYTMRSLTAGFMIMWVMSAMLRDRNPPALSSVWSFSSMPFLASPLSVAAAGRPAGKNMLLSGTMARLITPATIATGL